MDEIKIPKRPKPDPIRVLKATLPTRAEQEAYHRELEKVLPIKIFRLRGRWEWQRTKK